MTTFALIHGAGTVAASPGDWWDNTGYSIAVREQAAQDGGLTGNDDPYVSCFPPKFMRRLVTERLKITPDEITAGHCVALSRPVELADMLGGYADTPGSTAS